jgi:hypothetical protein
MIYISGTQSATTPSTAAFRNRNLPGLTIGKLSSIGVLAKPFENQLAYDGYIRNIEAFVYATIVKKKVTVNANHFPIPRDYIPTVPIPIPQTIFRLATKATPAQIEKMKAKFAGEDLESVQLGKGDMCYTITKPSFSTVMNILPRVAMPECARIDNYAQVKAVRCVLQLYQFVDGFLATNTYPYRKSDYNLEKGNRISPWAKTLEIRAYENIYRDGYGEKSKYQKIGLGKAVPKGRKIDDLELEDLTPNIDAVVGSTSTVLVAKPSPLPSSTCWGPPNSVPNLGGLTFPYFNGMLAPDVVAFRDLVSKLIFRNLGDEKTDCREAYRVFRQAIGMVASTPQAILLSHVLCGIDLALQAQAQLYLLFDGLVYLGFCLLGSEFEVFIHGKWYSPLSAEDLKVELLEFQTSDAALEALVEQLSLCSDANNESMMISKSDITTPRGLCNVLSQVAVDSVDKDSGVIDKISGLLARLSLPTNYKTMSAKNVVWGIEQLTTKQGDDLPDDLPIYVPSTNWNDIGERDYQVLGSFGPKSFSLRNAKGREFVVPDPAEQFEPFNALDEKGVLKYKGLIVMEKAIREALKDWRSFVGDATLRMDFEERAAGVRNHIFKDDDKDAIWSILKDAKAGGHLGVGESSVKRGKKRAFDDTSMAKDIDLDLLFA